jgi:hypothetical protein
MTAIKYLSLKGNCLGRRIEIIDAFPATLTMLNLNYMALKAVTVKGMEKLCKIISRLNCLSALFVSGNLLENHHFDMLSSMLQHLSGSLKSFIILGFGPSIPSLVSFLQIRIKMKLLTDLNLSG